jgi:hypothetical protein
MRIGKLRIGVLGLAVALLIAGSRLCSDTVTASIPSHPAAFLSPSHGVSVVAHGLKLSLAVSKSTYPRGALIRVAITLQNVARHSIAVGTTWGPECNRWGPGVQVVEAGGQIVYPPATEWLLGSCGKELFPLPLRSGGTVHRTTLAILRAADIQAVAMLGTDTLVATPRLHLHLISGPSPQLTLTTQPARITVVPGIGWGDRFYYLYSISCPVTAGETTLTGWATWTRGATGGDGVFRRSAECSSPVQWRFVGGWLDHPVAALSYPNR